jgi:hypothetical protein
LEQKKADKAAAAIKAPTGSASPERRVMTAILKGLVPASESGIAVAMPSGILWSIIATAIISPKPGLKM